MSATDPVTPATGRYPALITPAHFEEMREALYPSPPEGYRMVADGDRGDDVSLTFRLSSELRAAIRVGADAFELSMGEFCRRAVASVLLQRVVEPVSGPLGASGADEEVA